MAGKIMEGITSKTKRETLYARLQKADERLEVLQTIATVRSKWRTDSPETQHSVVITASEEDWMNMLEFLHDLRDVVPSALLRLYNGGRTMFADKIPSDEENDSPQGE